MPHNSQAGFSLVEALVTILIMTLVMGVIFSQISQGQRYTAAEQSKMDLFQEAREFIDQMSRDLRTSGYPNTHNYDHNPDTPSAEYTSSHEAVGLVKLDPANLWFEASTDGSGAVQVIRYHLDSTCTPLPCLVRSQTMKTPGDPLTQGESAQTELQNVKNGDTSDPIFQAFDAAGTPISSIDLANSNIANINSIAVKLTVQSPYKDHTGRQPTTTLFSTVRLNNCSLGYTTTANSVMGCH